MVTDVSRSSTQKVARRPASIKLRPSADGAWWDTAAAPLLAFVIATSGGRTWSEVYAWGKARRMTDTHIANQIAHLDLAKKIERVDTPSDQADCGFVVSWRKFEIEVPG